MANKQLHYIIFAHTRFSEQVIEGTIDKERLMELAKNTMDGQLPEDAEEEAMSHDEVFLFFAIEDEDLEKLAKGESDVFAYGTEEATIGIGPTKEAAAVQFVNAFRECQV